MYSFHWRSVLNKIIFFHRNQHCGFSIGKVTQTVVKDINNKEEYYVPCVGASFIAVLKNILYVFKHRKKNAINHITGDIHYCILGLIGCKSVLTIHDTVGLDFVKYSCLKRFVYRLLWYKIPLMFATHIVCISEETKRFILQHTHRKDIEVIYNAIDSKFGYSPKELNLESPRVLIIGTNTNKNLLRTFDALAGISAHLIIIGKLEKKHIESLNKNKISYENKSNISDDDIIEEYKKSDIVSFVSLFEGFGMPIIEANAIGRPVICSNLPVLQEVAKDAAEFVVDPYDTRSIRESFMKIIDNPQRCNELIENGLLNVSRFRKDVIQKKWRNLYDSL